VTIKDGCCLKASSVIGLTGQNALFGNWRKTTQGYAEDRTAIQRYFDGLHKWACEITHESQQRHIQSSAPETSEAMLQYKLGTAWIRKQLCRKEPGVPRGQHVGNESTVVKASCVPVCVRGCKGKASVLGKIIIPPSQH